MANTLGIHAVQGGSVQAVSPGPQAPKTGDTTKFATVMHDDATASSKDVAPSETSGKTPQDLLEEARKNLLASTARHMQSATKDIESEHLDKGF